MALGWPLVGRAGFGDPGNHAVTGFMDHNPAFPNQLLDYACGGRTYDSSSGYNHQGTDLYLWPFAWNKMDAGDVEVAAAAPGVIIGRTDGNPDRSCTLNSNRWNAVYVRHADGSVAWYGHLKRGSVTSRAVGATVAAGEYLGTVGSSGNSTGPHLHFELYDGGQLTDPYAGSCNPAAGGSWWASQRNYYDSGINRLATGTAAVSWGGCPNPDTPNEATRFEPGDRVTFSAYYRDQVAGKPTAYRIVAPDGSIYAQWNHAISRPHYNLSWWWWAYDLPQNVKTGTWRFEADFNGTSYRHTFHVDAPSTATPTATPGTIGGGGDRYIFLPVIEGFSPVRAHLRCAPFGRGRNGERGADDIGLPLLALNVGRPRLGMGRACRWASRAAWVAVRSSQGNSTVPKHIDCSWPLPQMSTMSPGRASPSANQIARPRSATRQKVWPSTPPAAAAAPAIMARMSSSDSVRGSSAVRMVRSAARAAMSAISRRLATSRLPALPKTVMTRPRAIPRAAAMARSSALGVWAKSTTTRNGWPRSMRSMRPLR